jgi:hypothetical protein
MSSILRNLFAVLAVLGVVPAAPAAVLFSETFSYPDGHLASAPPDGGVSGGLWTINGLNFGHKVDVSDGKVTLYHPTHPHRTAFSGEDVKRGFSALAAGQTIYAGLDVNAWGNRGNYFADFLGAGPKLFVTPFTGNDFTFGIGNENSSHTPTASWASGLTFHTTYRVVMSYDYDTGSAKLWVNPASESSTYVSIANTATRPLSTFGLYQSFTPVTTLPASQIIDNLVVGTMFDDVLAIPGPTISGDYHGDGTVGPEDYDVWKSDFGSTTSLAADGNGDGTVNTADYSVWRNHLGDSLGAGFASALPLPTSSLESAIPEPATLALAVVGVLGLARRIRRITLLRANLGQAPIFGQRAR